MWKTTEYTIGLRIPYEVGSRIGTKLMIQLEDYVKRQEKSASILNLARALEIVLKNTNPPPSEDSKE